MKHIAIVLVSLAILVGVAAGGAAQIPYGNHYKVYNTKEQPTLTISGLTVIDQWNTYRPKEVISVLELISNPVSKNEEPIVDPNLHYTWWRIDETLPKRQVNYKNQFEESMLTVTNGRYLLLPAVKDAEPDASIPKENHYRCYDATGGRGEFQVALSDQFGTRTALLTGPVLFCNPAEKRIRLSDRTEAVYPIVDERMHLTCYKIADPLTYGQRRTWLDQFFFGNLTADRDYLVCLPTEKMEPIPTEESTWGKIKSIYGE